MTYAVLALSFLSGALAVGALAQWAIGLGWRTTAAFAVAFTAEAVLMVAL